jgi:hypothetical protein
MWILYFCFVNETAAQDIRPPFLFIKSITRAHDSYRIIFSSFVSFRGVIWIEIMNRTLALHNAGGNQIFALFCSRESNLSAAWCSRESSQWFLQTSPRWMMQWEVKSPATFCSRESNLSTAKCSGESKSLLCRMHARNHDSPMHSAAGNQIWQQGVGSKNFGRPPGPEWNNRVNNHIWGTSVANTYENHPWKLSQLTIFWLPNKLRIKITPQIFKPKAKRVVGLNQGPRWVLLMEKTGTKILRDTIPLNLVRFTRFSFLEKRKKYFTCATPVSFSV